MIVLIDNYDSFSYNLYQLLGTITPDIKVIRNDEMSIAQIMDLHADHIVLSPGPGRPENAGLLLEIVKTFGRTTPILGVCLGHQAICAAYGASITYARELMHGKQSVITTTEDVLFEQCPAAFPAARYHSLAVDPETLPDCLVITAVADDGEIMAVRHQRDPVFGVQFHPESIMTPDGITILQNFAGINRPLPGQKSYDEEKYNDQGSDN